MMPHALLMAAKKASLTEVSTASGGSSQPPLAPPPFRFLGAFGGMTLARAGGHRGCLGLQWLVKQGSCSVALLLERFLTDACAGPYLCSLAAVAILTNVVMW